MKSKLKIIFLFVIVTFLLSTVIFFIGVYADQVRKHKFQIGIVTEGKNELLTVLENHVPSYKGCEPFRLFVGSQTTGNPLDALLRLKDTPHQVEYILVNTASPGVFELTTSSSGSWSQHRNRQQQ